MLAWFKAQFVILLLFLKCLQQYYVLNVTSRYLLLGISQLNMVYFTVFLQPNIRNHNDLIQIETFKVKSEPGFSILLYYQFKA
jgi:hypothetical protein